MKKVLIANRGEIALRIIRTCKEMGLETVVVYSTADRNSLPVLLADEAICIGTAQVLDSYINIPRIFAACEISSADAIHPGYGFLAENQHFAKMCEKAGITFIGPSSSNIKKLGDKVEAKKIAQKAGAPTVPGNASAPANVSQALAEAKDLGFPVVLKAVAGGGGKGIRFCYEEEEFVRLFAFAKNEAEKSFGDGRIYLEKLIVDPRHIEVQILADRFGQVIHLGERDCSTQRRRQKLIEESPSPILTTQQRAKVTEAAVKLCKEAGYDSVGTVEFLLDRDGNFYFMEVNTRIQVEHCVTEMVTGIDLIEEQIRVARGEKLRYRQSDINCTGHAIEFRINAEDPANNFSPCPGSIEYYSAPGGRNIRIDSHCYTGCTIPPYYDSMIAKLIVYGKNRNDAIERGKRALSEFLIGDIKTTIPFHQKMLTFEPFLTGELSINMIDQLMDQGKLQFHAVVSTQDELSP